MSPVNLYDTLHLEPRADDELRLDCRWATVAATPAASRSTALPQGAENIVVRALSLLRQRYAVRAGADIRLIKRIPVAAGLAGGSSDAAAALVAGNMAWKLGLTLEELAQTAAAVGSDVPFFLAGCAAVCRGRGEMIEPVTGLPPLHLVVVYPPAGLGTAEVYKACRPSEQPRRVAEIVREWRGGNIAAMGRLLHNQLQPAAAALSPWVDRLRKEFALQLLPGDRMSGSGASYFGLCRGPLHARQVAGRLRARGIGHVYTTRTCGS